MYGLSIGDKSSDILVNFGLLFRGAIFFQNGYLAHFLSERNEIGNVGVWPIDTYRYFLNFVNFGPGVP